MEIILDLVTVVSIILLRSKIINYKIQVMMVMMILVNKKIINKMRGRNFESSESSKNVEEGDDDGNTTTVRLKKQ